MKESFPYILLLLLVLFIALVPTCPNKEIKKEDTIKKEHRYIETEGKLTKIDAG